MLIIYIFALIGIFRCRERIYWSWLGILTAWMLVTSFLFSAGGTLENPTGDGLITHQIRLATNDGPAMGAFAILLVIVFWGVTLWIVAKLYSRSKKIVLERSQHEEGSDDPVFTGRKFAEAASLTIVAAAYIYILFIGSLPSLEAEPKENLSRGSSEDTLDDIARLVSMTADELNRSTPKRLDSITTLASVTAEGRVLIYHYEVSRMEGTEEELRTFVRENAVTAACKNDDMRKFMKEYGMTYRYSYLFPNPALPIFIDATYKECLSLGLG